VGGDGARPRREAMLLVIALACAVISAPIVLNLAGSRWETTSSFVLAASSFALVSFELHAEGRVDAVYFCGELVDAGVH
jgi:hypothetical protein